MFDDLTKQQLFQLKANAEKKLRILNAIKTFSDPDWSNYRRIVSQLNSITKHIINRWYTD